ncbi:helix-turn-helix domain-containing protein [Streptomyces sp. NBC_01217]|uniref:helix-turn-helix domain-containing protein n=1 Tax=Streptomyces sp. NBC_01217 TaxID=2903779 RepID=UPI002E116BB6|nr:XRE family transcriptional regulator [Streptomyces sp. NBC_01217]
MSEPPVTVGPPTPPRPPQAQQSAAVVVRTALAANLNRRRLARGWSLRELSAATGVSKGLLSQIERAEANPTVDVLVRIADVLDTNCTDLLRQPLLRPEIVRAASLDEPEDETSVNLLYSGHEHGRIEIYRTRLHPHAQSQVSSHGADSVEYVLVMSGQVTLVVNDVPHLLGTGDTARFSGLSSHYYTTEDSPAITHTIVGYPRD